VLGCARVSPGCDRCYAIVQARIRAGNPNPKVATAFDGLTVQTEGRADWTGRINLLPERLSQPLRWRKPRRVFVNSLSDLFHDGVPDEFIAQVFGVMASAQRHTFQLLTKRHARMRSLLSSPDFRAVVTMAALQLLRTGEPDFRALDEWPLPNVWLGVSVEDQKWADIRIPSLLATPAAVRFLSCEPLLGPLDLFGRPDQGCEEAGPGIIHLGHAMRTDYGSGTEWDCDHQCGIDWVIAGGESGPGARPMLPAWVRSLRDQCIAAEVPFFFKQWGAWSPTGWIGIGGHDPNRGFVGKPVDERGAREEIARTSKKAAGRVLDGRTWDEYPRTADLVTT
jgi:protein gp37